MLAMRVSELLISFIDALSRFIRSKLQGITTEAVVVTVMLKDIIVVLSVLAKIRLGLVNL